MAHFLKICALLMTIVVIHAACSAQEAPPLTPDQPKPTAYPGDSHVTLRWPEVANAMGYNLYWSTLDNKDHINLIQGIKDTVYIHDSLTNFSTYLYSVSAYDSNGESQPSDTLRAIPEPPPSPPAISNITPGHNSFTLEWQAVAHAVSYNIYMARERGITLENIEMLEGYEINRNVVSPLSITGLFNGQEYFFVITAINQYNDESPLSMEHRVIPTNILDIAAGYQHTCALTASKKIACWGDNRDAQIHMGFSNTLTVPTILPGEQRWKSITVGSDNTCALDDVNLAWCWGDNFQGQLGSLDVDIHSPMRMISTDNSLAFVSSSNDATCAVDDRHQIHCLGKLFFISSSTGTTMTAVEPLPVATEQSWRTVSIGVDHVCAIDVAHELYCWGRNDTGQLGVGAGNDGFDPVKIMEPGPWKEVIANRFNSCAIKNNGELWCWGLNENAMLGGSHAAQLTQPTLIAPNQHWKQVDLSEKHMCALSYKNEIACWGVNEYGQLGHIDNTLNYNMVHSNNQFPWIKVTTGEQHTCGLKSNGDIFCWGLNTRHQLGLATPLGNVPIKVNTSQNWESVHAGDYHTCAINLDKKLFCWGENEDGALGTNNYYSTDFPALSADNSTLWQSISAGKSHTCALNNIGTLFCWGDNAFGQLGINSDVVNFPVPQLVNESWRQVSSGDNFTCAIKNTDASLWCWGDHRDYQLGFIADDAIRYDQPLSPINFPDHQWKHISAGGDHACAIDTNDILYCWGNSQYGQAGNAFINKQLPQAIGGILRWDSVSLGQRHSCAISLERKLYCWGNNEFGQLGTQETTPYSTPHPVDSNNRNWKEVRSGGFHTCAIDEHNQLFCWGFNRDGQLGLGHFRNQSSPALVDAQASWKTISLGALHTCGLHNDNTLWCWGSNLDGQLGSDSAWISQPQPLITRELH